MNFIKNYGKNIIYKIKHSFGRYIKKRGEEQDEMKIIYSNFLALKVKVGI